jgi:Gp37 protein
MNLKTVETDIVERLKEYLPGISVEPFPDSPDSYRMTHQVGAVLVAYGGGTYGQPRALDVVVTDRVQQWHIHVVARSLAGHQGAYRWLEAARMVLSGWRPSDSRAMHPRSERFVGQKSGLWTYVLAMECDTVAVEVDGVDLRGALADLLEP